MRSGGRSSFLPDRNSNAQGQGLRCAVVLLLGLVLRPLNFDRAFGHERRNCAYSCQRRRKRRADHADGEWKFRDRSTILLDDHATDVSLPDEALKRVEQQRATRSDRFPVCLRAHSATSDSVRILPSN